MTKLWASLTNFSGSAHVTVEDSFAYTFKKQMILSTPDRRHSKTLLTIDERGSKIARNIVFDCHLSPVRRQMAIKNSVSHYLWSAFVNSINVFDCRLPSVFSICFRKYVPEELIPFVELIGDGMENYIHPPYAGEMKGIAKTLNGSVGDVVLANLIYDITA